MGSITADVAEASVTQLLVWGFATRRENGHDDPPGGSVVIRQSAGQAADPEHLATVLAIALDSVFVRALLSIGHLDLLQWWEKVGTLPPPGDARDEMPRGPVILARD
jgi:hypothetical protein